MRKLFADLFLIVAAMLLPSSCAKQDTDGSNILTGEWKLEEVGGIPATDLIQDGYGAVPDLNPVVAAAGPVHGEDLILGEIQLHNGLAVHGDFRPGQGL